MKNQKTSISTDEQVAVAPPSQIEEALEQGNITAAVEAIASNPDAIAHFVQSTELALVEGKDKAKVIRDRGFFKKLFSSSTSDLAKLLLEQNDVLTRFFVMLQLLIVQSKGNAKYLSEICSAIKNASEVGDAESGNLQRIAVNFLEQNIEAAKAERVRDLALMKLLKSAELNAVFEQDMRAAEAKAEARYEASTKQLKNDYDAFVSTVNGKINTQNIELQKKATPQDISNAISSLAQTLNQSINERAKLSDIDKAATSITEDVNKRLETENKRLRKQVQTANIIGSIGLIIAIFTILISVFNLI